MLVREINGFASTFLGREEGMNIDILTKRINSFGYHPQVPYLFEFALNPLKSKRSDLVINAYSNEVLKPCTKPKVSIIILLEL